jgi:hypothetical protein
MLICKGEKKVERCKCEKGAEISKCEKSVEIYIITTLYYS